MGDIIEDAGMVRDHEHHTVIKVGFLNTEERYNTQLDSYKENFDLIILKDGTLKPIINSLK